MRFFRFSLRRFLVFTAVVAVALYVLILRPPALAKKFAQDLEGRAQVNFKAVGKKYFGGWPTAGSHLEFELRPRSWRDVLRCRQEFPMRLVGPPDPDNVRLLSVRDFLASPIGVSELDLPLLFVRYGPGESRPGSK